MATTGGCSCGAVRYSAEGEPDWAGWCHCRDCQRESGSDRRPFMGFARPAVTVTGAPTRYLGAKTPSDDPAVGTYFCPTCGTIVFGIPGSAPGYYSIYAGTLDDPAAFAPHVAIFTSRRWPQAAAALPEFAEMPPH